MLRQMARTALRIWGRSLIAPGYHYIAVERYGARLAGRELLHAKLPNGCRIRCDLHDHVQRHQWFFGAYEPIESYIFCKLLRPGMTVVDAGANVGQYTLLASTILGPTGSVHAFEPVPENFRRLSECVHLNDLANVSLNRVALWHEATTLRFDLPADEPNNAGSYCVVAEASRGKLIEAQALRLDDYVASAKIDKIDLIKMDIEGSEPFALQGARATLERDRPIILMEINRASLAGTGNSPEALADQLRPLGYRTWRIAQSANESGPIADVAGIDRVNVLLHHEGIPEDILKSCSLKNVLRWSYRLLDRAES